MAKPLRVAGECDSYCTKCRMILNHRIVSMVGPKPHQVLCLTCSSQHLFRAGMPGEKATSSSSGKTSGKTASSRASSGSRPPTRAALARQDRERTWEKAVSGKALGEFRAYNVTTVFSDGDLVRHKVFGDGVVVRVVDEKKIEVLFKDEARTLAHAMQA